MLNIDHWFVLIENAHSAIPEYFVLFLLGNFMCGNSVVASLPSATETYRAVLFERNCGATTGFSTQISLLRNDERLFGSGNVFVADADRGAVEEAYWRGPFAAVEWTAEGTLLIQFDAEARVFLMVDNFDDVKIEYQAIER